MTALAVALPGIDPVTTLIEMVPLLSLYLISLGRLRVLRAALACPDRATAAE